MILERCMDPESWWNFRGIGVCTSTFNLLVSCARVSCAQLTRTLRAGPGKTLTIWMDWISEPVIANQNLNFWRILQNIKQNNWRQYVFDIHIFYVRYPDISRIGTIPFCDKVMKQIQKSKIYSREKTRFVILQFVSKIQILIRTNRLGNRHFQFLPSPMS